MKYNLKTGAVKKLEILLAGIMCLMFVLSGCSSKSKKSILGSGNASNGGFATGNGKLTFYVSTNQFGESTLWMEEDSSGNIKRIRDSVCTIDSLNLAGNSLFFRSVEPSQIGYDISIWQYSIEQDATKLVYISHSENQDELSYLTVWDDSLYFSERFKVLKCDLDGNNKTILYDSDSKYRGISCIPICVSSKKVFFVNPENFATGGSYYGEVYSMNHDGSDIVGLGVKSDSESNFFTDGTWLYYMSSRCKLDGSVVETLYDYSAKINSLNDDVYVSTSEGIQMLGKNESSPIKTSGSTFEGFVIVANRIFYRCYYEGEQVLCSIRMDGTGETILCGSATKYISSAFDYYRSKEGKPMSFIVMPSDLYDSSEEFGEITFTIRTIDGHAINGKYAEVYVDSNTGEMHDDKGNIWSVNKGAFGV